MRIGKRTQHSEGYRIMRDFTDDEKKFYRLFGKKPTTSELAQWMHYTGGKVESYVDKTL